MLPKFGLPRLMFPKGKQREFLELVFQKSGLRVDDIAKIVKVSPRTIRDWKREKFHITENAIDIICNKFEITPPRMMSKMVEKWRIYKYEISRKGGFAYYNKYGLLGSIESRRRGGIAGIAKLREMGLATPIKIFNLPKQSIKLAEFVGIMLGDGHIDKIQIEITLNSIADADYSNFVLNLCNELYCCYPKMIKAKNCNALRIYYNGINLVKFLTSIGMIVGNKVKQQVGVPEWINNKIEYKIACLRGLMDTDGGIFIHKYKVNKKIYSYKKICFVNRSMPLLYFVYNTLNELGFTAKLIDKVENKRVWLYNTQEIQKYLEIVKSNNQRLNKYIIG